MRTEYLWRKITGDLAGEIKNGKTPQDSKALSADKISGRFKVSNITSRRVLAELSRLGLLEKGRGKGCRVKIKPQIKCLHILVGSERETFPGNLSRIFTGVNKGIADKSAELGLETKYVTCDYLRMLPPGSEMNLIIMQNIPLHAPDVTAMLFENKNFKCVCAQAYAPLNSMTTVRCDITKGAYLAAKHILETGRLRIGMIGALNREWGALKFDGYYRALREKAVILDTSLVKNVLLNGDYEEDSAAAAELLKNPNPPDAILAANDINALNIVRYLKESGIRVPEDIAVVGFDNIPETELCDPPVTSVETLWVEQGREAVGAIVEMNENLEYKHKDILLEPKLIRRGSS